MIITPFLFLTYLNPTNSGAQYYPNHSSNTPGTRVEKFGKELLWKQTLSRWTKIDASEFHNVKLNAKEMVSPKLGTILKNRRWTIKFIGGDHVLRTPTLTRYHPSSRRSSRRTSWRIRRVSTTDQSKKSLHINTVFTEISDILTKIVSKNIWENLSWICSTSRLAPSITGKTSCYRGPGVIDDLLLVKLVWYITSNTMTSGKCRLNTDSNINWMWECRRASTERPVA